MTVGRIAGVITGVVSGVLVAVPLALSDGVLHKYSVPKFAVLAVGSALLFALLLWRVARFGAPPAARSPLALAMGAYLAGLAISTALGDAPDIALQGSFGAQMGLASYLCFGVVFYGVLVGVGADQANFERVLRAVVVAGFVVSLWAAAQLAGLAALEEPFSGTGKFPLRVYATLGHPDFAGHFLLFVVFAALGAAVMVRTRFRLVALATSALAAVAILFTGTRGAWAGFVAGCLVAVGTVAASRGAARDGLPLRRLAAGAGVVILGLLLVVTFTRLGAPVRARAAAFAGEGYTGGGRTTVWMLSARMVPRYWLTGCGLETFPLAQVPFKTREYARETYGTNAEDPHSAYLSALVGTGIVGTIPYCALVVLTLAGLVRALRSTRRLPAYWVGVSLLSSVCAVLIHDVFTHKMIANGLYFFAFLALSRCWLGIVEASGNGKAAEAQGAPERPRARWREAAALAAGGAVFVLACAYTVRLVEAERSILACLSAARRGNADATVAYGERATSKGLHQTDLHFYYGAALETLATKGRDGDARRWLTAATEQMEAARARNLAPVASTISLAIVRVRLGDFTGAESLIREAEAADPTTYLVPLARARLSLERGEVEEAREQVRRMKAAGAPRSVRREMKAVLAGAE
jgi:O-antigen ligase